MRALVLPRKVGWGPRLQKPREVRMEQYGCDDREASPRDVRRTGKDSEESEKSERLLGGVRRTTKTEQAEPTARQEEEKAHEKELIARIRTQS